MTRIICLLFIVLAVGCTNNDINKKFDCSTSDLAIELASKTNTTSCKAIDGKLSVSATGGKAPYDFSLNGGAFQTNTEFANLGPGTYNVIVQDANGCKVTSVEIEVSAANSNLDASKVIVSNSQCLNPNGSITVIASGGTGPYAFQFGTGGFGTNNVFSNLKADQYAIVVKDANDCLKTINAIVPRVNTNTVYSSSIKPILDASCNLASCHGSGTGSRDWTNFSNLKSKAANVKARTANRSMPIGSVAPLTQAQIDLIGCWVDDGAPEN